MMNKLHINRVIKIIMMQSCFSNNNNNSQINMKKVRKTHYIIISKKRIKTKIKVNSISLNHNKI